MSTTVKDKNEITVSRIFDAPRESVWKDVDRSERLKSGGGQKTFTVPEIKIDFTVGGKYLYCMRGAGASDSIHPFQPSFEQA